MKDDMSKIDFKNLVNEYSLYLLGLRGIIPRSLKKHIVDTAKHLGVSISTAHRVRAIYHTKQADMLEGKITRSKPRKKKARTNASSFWKMVHLSNNGRTINEIAKELNFSRTVVVNLLMAADMANVLNTKYYRGMYGLADIKSATPIAAVSGPVDIDFFAVVDNPTLKKVMSKLVDVRAYGETLNKGLNSRSKSVSSIAEKHIDDLAPIVEEVSNLFLEPVSA